MKNTNHMLCLIKSGETAWQIDGRLQGSMDLPLSMAGRVAVDEDLPRIKSSKATVVYHPKDEAAAATAQLCAQVLECKTKAVADLGDPHLGLLEGLTEQEFSERFPTRFRQWEEDFLSLAPPEGEEIAVAADRIYRAVVKLLKRAKDEEIAIVLHPLALAMVRSWLADWPLHDLRATLVNRPRIERYVVPTDMLAELEAAASSEFVRL